MTFAGIDIGKTVHGFAVVKNRNNNFVKPRMVNNDLDGLTQVHNILQEHAPDKKDVIIGMEATGHYWRPYSRRSAADNDCQLSFYSC